MWCRYRLTCLAIDVLQTNLGYLIALIPLLPTGSKQQSELGEIASTLRAQSRANLRLERYGSQLQHYGSRWQLRVTRNVHYPHRGMQLVLFMNLCAYRANIFLRARTTAGPQTSSSAARDQHSTAGDATGLMHEPWSDFGID